MNSLSPTEGQIIQTAAGLALDVGFGKPLHVDFLRGPYGFRWRQGVRKDDLLGRALGVRKGTQRVLDATAGLASDTLNFLLLGCEVIAVERSEGIYRILADAVGRARTDERWREKFSQRLTLHHTDARDFLREIKTHWPEENWPDVVFLDPMFPEGKRRGAAKGEMQKLKALLGASDLNEQTELLDLAKAVARRRVVRKCPHDVSANLSKPDQIFSGRGIKYEVWFTSV